MHQDTEFNSAVERWYKILWKIKTWFDFLKKNNVIVFALLRFLGYDYNSWGILLTLALCVFFPPLDLRLSVLVKNAWSRRKKIWRKVHSMCLLAEGQQGMFQTQQLPQNVCPFNTGFGLGLALNWGEKYRCFKLVLQISPAHVCTPDYL